MRSDEHDMHKNQLLLPWINFINFSNECCKVPQSCMLVQLAITKHLSVKRKWLGKWTKY